MGQQWALLLMVTALQLDQDEYQFGWIIWNGPVVPVWTAVLPVLALDTVRLNLETADSRCVPDSPVYLLLYVDFISSHIEF